VFIILDEKSEGKRSLGRHRRVWGDNIRMDLKEIGRKVVKWMHLAQDRDQWRVLLNTVIKLQVPLKARNLLSS
jgi:hypothetical protein